MQASTRRPFRRLAPTSWATGGLGALALLVVASCGDVPQPTAPVVPPSLGVTAAAKPVSASIRSVEYTAPLVIEGAGFDVTVTVENASKSNLKEISVLARMKQSAASRDLGRALVMCPGATPGVMPGNSSCPVQLQVSVTNSAPGTGTLVAGEAEFEFVMLQVSGKKENVLDSSSEFVTLEDPELPFISDFVLETTEFVLGGPAVDYTITIQNPGPPLTGVIVQAEISQGTAVHGAGGTIVQCPDFDGNLPSGECTFEWHAFAANVSGGDDLVPGPANLQIQLIGTELYYELSFDITIVADEPEAPFIEDFVLEGTEFILGGPAVDYTITIQNPGPPLSPVVVQAEISQGTAVHGAGGTNVQCPDIDGNLPTGECTFTWHAFAANVSGGDDLVPGPANLQIQLIGTEVYDEVNVDITIVAAEPEEPHISNVQLASTEFVIEGPTVGYTATIQNPGDPLSNVVVQAYISQGAADRGAGGTLASCTLQNGELPTGECSHSYVANASNTGAGSGTLAPGAAELRIELWQSTTLLDSYPVDITLVADEPEEPTQLYISDFQLASTTFTLGGPSVAYSYTLTNPIEQFYEGVSVWGTIRQGENFRIAGEDHPNCGAGGPGNVNPLDTCGSGGSYLAWNGNSGSGDLVPGAAILEIELRMSPHITLETFEIPITLQ